MFIHQVKLTGLDTDPYRDTDKTCLDGVCTVPVLRQVNLQINETSAVCQLATRCLILGMGFWCQAIR